ncbi:MAG: MFS transporter, partial [Tumebacillaceae bacterium]
YFVGHFNWHWVFLINIPVGVLAGVIMSAGMRESIGTEKKKVDWAGAGTLVLALMSLLMAPVLIDNEGYTWTSPVILALLALFVLLVFLLIRIERKSTEPILPLHLFKNRNVVVLSILTFTLMLGTMGGIVAFPFFAQNVMGMTPTASGYLSLAFMAGAIPASILNGFLITRVPYRSLFIVSFVLPIVGFALLSRVDIDTTVWFVIISFFILGVGIGALFGGDNLIVQESVDKKDSGIALSTVQLFQSLGATIGLSIFGSLLSKDIKGNVASLADQFPPGTLDNIETGGIPKGLSADLVTQVKLAFAHAFQNIFWYSIIFAAAAFVICWFLKREVLSKREETDGVETA